MAAGFVCWVAVAAFFVVSVVVASAAVVLSVAGTDLSTISFSTAVAALDVLDDFLALAAVDFFFDLATGRNPGRCFRDDVLEVRGTNDTGSVEDDGMVDLTD